MNSTDCQENIDISSIIENKILTKTFWEEKMLDDEKLNLKTGRLLTPNREDKKAIKLSSDGESEQSLDSSLTQDSSIDAKLVEQDYASETKGQFVKRSIVEKVDQQSDTEEELYSDCLEQFVDDQIDRLTIGKRNLNSNDATSDCSTDVKMDSDELIVSKCDNELSVIEEEDSGENRLTSVEKELQTNRNELNTLDIANGANLRVKVEGSEEDCMNNVTNRTVQPQEQVIEAMIVEKRDKPRKQGDQVTQSTICSAVFTDCAVEEASNNSKCLKANSSLEKCSESCQTVQSSSDHVLVAKSITSESPSIFFQQRVSVVKSTFENLKSTNAMMSSTPEADNVIKYPMKCLKRTDVNNERHIETESKIARELRELKQREDELRQMRLERLNKERLVNCTITCLDNCSTANCPKNYLSSANSTTSSVDSTINQSSDKSSDKSSERSDSPPSNDQCVSSIDSLDEGFGEYKSPNSASKLQSTDSSKSNPGEIQKILATTRIQQEIEEQTRRELALKAAGSIKTISQERTDKYSMSSNLLLGNLGANVLSPTLSLSSLASSLSSLNITNNSQSNSINQTTGDQPATPISVTTSKLTTSNSTNQQSITCLSSIKATRTNLYTKHTASITNTATPLKHRTFSTSHLNNLTNNSSTSPLNLFKMNQTGRHISMHKFIATKGRSASSNQFSNNVGHSELSYSYSDLLRPPKLDPVKVHKIIEKKCLLSADYKISSELRDIYQREQELRKQRARTIGQSQPNLSLLDSSEEQKDRAKLTGHQPDNKELIDVDQAQQKFTLEGCRARPLANLLKKATSNPNLTGAQLLGLQTEHPTSEQLSKSACKEVNLCSSSKLIAQWENKIEILKTEKIK